MEPYLWWDAIVKARFCSEVCGVPSLYAMLERTKFVARGRPALPRCADTESGDKMIDRVLVPVIWRLRSLGL